MPRGARPLIRRRVRPTTSSATTGLAFRIGATGSANTGSAISLTVPTSVVANDLLVWVVSVIGDRTWPSPSGWTQIRTDTGSGSNPTTVRPFWKIAAGTEAGTTLTITFTGGTFLYGVVQLLAYSGADQVNPINANNATTSGSNGTTITAPSVTTTADGCLILACHGGAGTTSSVNTVTGPSTVRTALAPASTFVGASVSEQTQPVAGATPGTSATIAQSSAWVGTTLAIKPA